MDVEITRRSTPPRSRVLVSVSVVVSIVRRFGSFSRRLPAAMTTTIRVVFTVVVVVSVGVGRRVCGRSAPTPAVRNPLMLVMTTVAFAGRSARSREVLS